MNTGAAAITAGATVLAAIIGAVGVVMSKRRSKTRTIIEETQKALESTHEDIKKIKYQIQPNEGKSAYDAMFTLMGNVRADINLVRGDINSVRAESQESRKEVSKLRKDVKVAIETHEATYHDEEK